MEIPPGSKAISPDREMLQSFIGNGDFSIWVHKFRGDNKQGTCICSLPTNPQTLITISNKKHIDASVKERPQLYLFP